MTTIGSIEMLRKFEDGSSQSSGAMVTETGRFATDAVDFAESRSQDAKCNKKLCLN